MIPSISMIVLTILSVIFIEAETTKFPCPESCQCRDLKASSTSSSGLWIRCKPRSSSAIPEVDPSVTFFDLSGGNYPVLNASTFRATQNIRKLFLNASKVQTIHQNTFTGLRDLEFLSLTGNNLTSILLDSFWNLRSGNLRGE